LTAELVSDYPGGSYIHAKQLGVPQVVRVSETSYSVCGIPDTTAEIGFVHVKKINGSFMCSVKHCRVLSGGKQLKTCHVCLHVHLLSCCLGLWKAPLAASATVIQSCSVTNSASHSSVATSTLTSFASTSSISTVNSSITSVPTSDTSSVSRTSTIKLNLATRFPYHIPLQVISAARTADSRTLCGIDGGWPKQFIAADVVCRLCGSDFHPPSYRCHPGSQGKAVLITNSNPFLSVEVKVKICKRQIARRCISPKFMI